MDRFSSIRIAGSKRDRPAVPSSRHQPSLGHEQPPPSPNPFQPSVLSEKEVLALFEKMMEDMNLNETHKAPLRQKDLVIKREMVMQYINAAAKSGLKSRSDHALTSSQEYIHELRAGIQDERLLGCLESLRVSLNSNPVSWVENFGHEGLGLLLDMLNSLQNSHKPENITRKNQHEIVRCLKAFMNNKYGLMRMLSEEQGILLLARAIEPAYPPMMADAVKLLSALCILEEERTHERILEALTQCGEQENRERFSTIVKGLGQRQGLQLKVGCMQLINALLTSVDELDFRLHLRNEFMRCGLVDILQDLIVSNDEPQDVQLRVFEENREDDFVELSHRYEDIRFELEYPFEVFQIVSNIVKDTLAEPYFLSILQHLLLIRNDYFVRPQYYKLIEECVSQIILHRNGVDPDFRHGKRFQLEVEHLVDVLVDKAKVDESESKAAACRAQLDAELMARQEAQVTLQRREADFEARLRELEAENQRLRQQHDRRRHGCKVTGGPRGGAATADVPPPPPYQQGQGIPGGPMPPPPPPLPG
uniref:GBD/FH3 domain-containing protein n=1 Tax=Petromyzon marinus TaxID=7757 RepID=S4S030_PETMA